MIIKEVECSATFNLGNFQSVKFGMTAMVNMEQSTPDNNQDAAEIMKELRRLINIEAQDQGVKPNSLLRE